MSDTRIPPAEPGAALLRAGRFFRPGTAAPDLQSIALTGGREADAFYRDRWSHDKIVNSTHGMNCTGSCASLERLAAMRSHMRAINLGEEPEESVTGAAGMQPAEIEEMYRLPAIAKYEDRYVIPTAAVGDARRLEESALPESCSLDYEGGPGAGGDGPFGQDSGRRRLPLVSLENFHALRRRQTTDEAKET